MGCSGEPNVKKEKIENDNRKETTLNRENKDEYNIEEEIDKENKDKSKKEKIKDYLDKLYKSYYEAKTYFCSNDMKEKEVDAIKKCKKILEAKALLKEGEYKKIKMDELPKKVTPEYITGYINEEKKEKIELIISYLNKEKEDAKKNMNNKMEELKSNIKKIKKENIKKFEEAAKIILDKEKNKITQISKDIAVVNKIMENEYIPVPEYVIYDEEFKIEKINEDIPENVIHINVSNLTYTKSNPLITLNLSSEDYNLTKEIKDNINESFEWSLDEKKFKHLFRNKINLILERTYMIKKNKIKGVSEISLRNLKDTNTINESYKIKMESGKSDTSIDILIQIRSSIVNKEYESIYKEVLKIKRIYPQFNINGNNYYKNNEVKDYNQPININQILEEIEMKNDNKKVESKIIEENSNINDDNINVEKSNNNISNYVETTNKEIIKENNNIDNNNSNSSNEKIDKNIFKEEELEDVDYIDNLNSLKVLKDRLIKIEEKISKIDGRTPRELLQKKVKINVKIKTIEGSMGEGELSPKDYSLILDTQLKHDILLCKYLKQENEIEKAKIVYTRIKLLNEEINELKQYL